MTPQLQLWSPQRRTTCRTRCPVGLSRSTARKFGATLSWPSPATVRRPGTDRWTCRSTTSTVTGTTFWSRSTGVHREARLPNGSSPTSDPDATRATRTATLGRRDLGCLRDPVRAGRAGRAAGRRLRRRPGDLESRTADHPRRDRHRDPRRPLEGRPVALAGPGPGQRGCHVLAAGGPGGGAELRVVPGPGDGRGAGEYGSRRAPGSTRAAPTYDSWWTSSRARCWTRSAYPMSCFAVGAVSWAARGTRTDNDRQRLGSRHADPSRWSLKSGLAFGLSMPMFEFLSAHLVTVEQCPNFGLPESPMTPWRPDASDASRCGPSGDGLRVDAEQCGHFARRQQTIASVHDSPLASSGRIRPEPH